MNNYKGTWAIQFTSSFARSLQSKSSKHFNVFSDDGFNSHEEFFFTSAHVDFSDVEDPQIAFFRLEALIKILNGILNLNNQPGVSYSSGNIYHVNSFNNRWTGHTIYRNTQLKYGELQNPFSIEKSKLINLDGYSSKSDYVVDLFDLAYNEELVKEVFIFLSLIKTDPLYLLVNVSKIVENIKFDLGFDKNKKEDGENMSSREKRYSNKKVLDEISEVLKDNFSFFQNSYNFFTNKEGGSFHHFVNTRDGSGIFARHGATSDKYDNQQSTISFKEIEHNIQALVFEWINYKLIKSKRYRYPPIKQTSRIVDLKDETFNFDL